MSLLRALEGRTVSRADEQPIRLTQIRSSAERRLRAGLHGEEVEHLSTLGLALGLREEIDHEIYLVGQLYAFYAETRLEAIRRWVENIHDGTESWTTELLDLLDGRERGGPMR